VSFLSVRLVAFYQDLGLVGLPYRLRRQLLYDLATWWRLLIRDDQLAVGALVNVIVLGLALRNDSEPKKKGNQSCVDAFHRETSPFYSTGLSLFPVGVHHVYPHWTCFFGLRF